MSHRCRWTFISFVSVGIIEVEVQEATLDQLARNKKEGKKRDSDPGSYEWRRHQPHSFDRTRIEWLEYETLMCEKGSGRSRPSSVVSHITGSLRRWKIKGTCNKCMKGVIGRNLIAEEPAMVSMASRGKLSCWPKRVTIGVIKFSRTLWSNITPLSTYIRCLFLFVKVSKARESRVPLMEIEALQLLNDRANMRAISLINSCEYQSESVLYRYTLIVWNNCITLLLLLKATIIVQRYYLFCGILLWSIQ